MSHCNILSPALIWWLQKNGQVQKQNYPHFIKNRGCFGSKEGLDYNPAFQILTGAADKGATGFAEQKLAIQNKNRSSGFNMPDKGLSVQCQGANMPFESVPGLKGKVYVPEESREGSKKYSCQDCFSCQRCSDDRCGVCLSLRRCSCGKQVRKKPGVCQSKSYKEKEVHIFKEERGY